MRLKITCLGMLGLLSNACGGGSVGSHSDLESARSAVESGTTTYVSDLEFATSSNGWGPAERDQSNGETEGGDGAPLTLNGIAYSRGLGVHAGSRIAFDINGEYVSFESDIGVDD